MRRFISFLASSIVLTALALVTVVLPASADHGGKHVGGGGGPDGDGIAVRSFYNEGSGRAILYPSGDDPCEYAAPAVTPQGAFGPVLLPGVMVFDDLIVMVYIERVCNDDTDERTFDAGFYPLGPPEADLVALAAQAYENEIWHDVEVITGPDPVVVSGLPVAFSLDGDPRGYGFDDLLIAEADAAGVVVTATANAVNVEWQAGSINSKYGGPDFVDCDNFGDLSLEFPVDTPCHFTWLSSSALEPGGRITMIATIEYEIVYTTNLPPALGLPVFGDPDHFHVIERPGYAVSEAHSVIQE